MEDFDYNLLSDMLYESALVQFEYKNSFGGLKLYYNVPQLNTNSTRIKESIELNVEQVCSYAYCKTETNTYTNKTQIISKTIEPLANYLMEALKCKTHHYHIIQPNQIQLDNIAIKSDLNSIIQPNWLLHFKYSTPEEQIILEPIYTENQLWIFAKGLTVQKTYSEIENAQTIYESFKKYYLGTPDGLKFI